VATGIPVWPRIGETSFGLAVAGALELAAAPAKEVAGAMERLLVWERVVGWESLLP